MKKNVFCLMALCLSALAIQAQQQVFTIEGYVDEELIDSCYNIYLGDEYFHIQGEKPVATVPVVNKRFTYSISLEKMTCGRIRGIFPGNELCSAWVDIFFVPGETVKLNVHNGYYDLDKPYSYQKKIERAVNAVRNETNWISPYMPNLKGKAWKAVETDDLFSTVYVKEVYFGKEETVLRLLSDYYYSPIEITEKSYILDDRGNKYQLKRAMFGDLEGNNRQDVRIFGAYYAFEPVPKGAKILTFVCPGYGRMNIREAKMKKKKPNFELNIHVSEGIGDSGYLIERYYKTQRSKQIADIPAENKKCTFSTYLDQPYLADVTATFPDGSICSHCMRFPIVPGEKAELKVMNGRFFLSGTGFYEEWSRAGDLADNAPKYRTAAEVKAIYADYLKEHAQEEGVVMYYIYERLLPRKTIEEIVPESVLNGRMADVKTMLEYLYGSDW